MTAKMITEELIKIYSTAIFRWYSINDGFARIQLKISSDMKALLFLFPLTHLLF